MRHSASRYNDTEMKRSTRDSASWHEQYKDSPHIYVGGLPYDVDETDVETVFSQYGVVAQVSLAKELETGKSKGYAFVSYEDARSAILAVDNMDGIDLLGRKIRVDHAARMPQTKPDKRPE